MRQNPKILQFKDIASLQEYGKRIENGQENLYMAVGADAALFKISGVAKQRKDEIMGLVDKLFADGSIKVEMRKQIEYVFSKLLDPAFRQEYDLKISMDLPFFESGVNKHNDSSFRGYKRDDELLQSPVSTLSGGERIEPRIKKVGRPEIVLTLASLTPEKTDNGTPLYKQFGTYKVKEGVATVIATGGVETKVYVYNKFNETRDASPRMTPTQMLKKLEVAFNAIQGDGILRGFRSDFLEGPIKDLVKSKLIQENQPLNDLQKLSIFLSYASKNPKSSSGRAMVEVCGNPTNPLGFTQVLPSNN